MMITLVITLSVSILWTSGLVDGNDVTQKPSIKFEQKGLSAQINCSHNKGASYFHMYWYRQLPGEAMKQVVYSTTSKPEYYGDFTEDKYSTNKTVAESGSFTVKMLEAGDSGMYFCAVSQRGDFNPAYFGSGTKLTVLEPGVKVTKPTVKVLPPSPQEGKGKGRKKKKTLVCVATDFYPDHVTVSWQINNINISEGVATDDQAKQDNNTRKYSITSRLRVNTRDWNKDDNSFTCTVNFYDGKNTIPVSDSIDGVEGAEVEMITAETYVKRTQTGKLVYIVFIAKSTFYGLVVMVLIWKLKDSSAKKL